MRGKRGGASELGRDQRPGQSQEPGVPLLQRGRPILPDEAHILGPLLRVWLPTQGAHQGDEALPRAAEARPYRRGELQLGVLPALRSLLGRDGGTMPSGAGILATQPCPRAHDGHVDVLSLAPVTLKCKSVRRSSGNV